MSILLKLRYGAITGFADYATMFTWRTWVIGWISRVLAQVTFFALIGYLLGSREQVAFLLIGNAVMIAVMDTFGTVASTTLERQAGTLPLLVASPTGLAVVFFGRSIHSMISGTLSSTIALFALGPLFGVSMPMPNTLLAIPCTFVVAFSTYCLGLVLGGIALRVMSLRNIISNLGWLTIMAICGVQTPLTFWPHWVQTVASGLPATHGLMAIRGVLSASPTTHVAAHVGYEILVALGWLTVAVFVFRHLAEQGRRNGSIEFGD